MSQGTYISIGHRCAGSPDEHVILIDRELRSKEDLLQELAEKARFPSYFGENWDALYDCLNDLSWIQERKVALVQASSLDHLSDHDIRTYLSILIETARRWAETDEKQFLILVSLDCAANSTVGELMLGTDDETSSKIPT
jgi:RNAse (barnase) inhibitor barstar